MLNKVVIWYLKHLEKQTGFGLESIEMAQDSIKDANRVWNYYRENKEALKKSIDYIHYLDR
ncbi:hypothetical protein ACEN4P_01390 [Marinilactibacillus psychrotolerans]|uniref:hypothetical protein n=1 Tax=Marinilactibacillus psychrotolerans TaxID=191770 RepID=UPI00388847F6